MRFVVFGAGALGSFIGALLSKRYDVLLVGRGGHIRAIEERGLRIEGLTNGLFRLKTKGNGRYDLVILTTKAYDSEKAIREIMERFGKIPVLSLQNGIRNEKIIEDIMGRGYAIGGITSHGITLIEDGRIYHAGKGETVIGELNGEMSERVRKIASAFNECGIETRISSNIMMEIWKKAIVNSAINTITSIFMCRNGEILNDRHAMLLIQNLCVEGMQVAKAEGIEIEGVLEKVIEIAEKTANNYSSMLQDMMRGKKTEVDEINGEIIRLAKKHGISVPTNEVVYHIIKGMENVRRLGWPDGHLLSRRGP